MIIRALAKNSVSLCVWVIVSGLCLSCRAVTNLTRADGNSFQKMGSFSSTPRIDNPDSADNNVIETFKRCSPEELLARCRRELESAGRPPLLNRSMRSVQSSANDPSNPPLRVLQWNLLSQSLGLANDNFTLCPLEALVWESRRFQILEEIIQHNPDIICLQEVDHFGFLEAALGSIGYEGRFMPKPDSPCVYLEGNNGPDGCALFYKTCRFELLTTQTRVLEVWRVQSNQVGLLCVIQDKLTRKELCVATTHLKARAGALLATLRDNQGKDLLDWIVEMAGGRPVVLTGDFNAEPLEPVYHTTTNHKLHLRSGYCDQNGEPPYTTWKVRGEGEMCHTIDYIFHSSSSQVWGGLKPRSWTNAELTEALQHVWNKKMTTYQASRIFGIPYNSLIMYVRGKYGKSLKLEQLKKDCLGSPGSNAGNNNNHPTKPNNEDINHPQRPDHDMPLPPGFNPYTAANF